MACSEPVSARRLSVDRVLMAGGSSIGDCSQRQKRRFVDFLAGVAVAHDGFGKDSLGGQADPGRRHRNGRLVEAEQIDPVTVLVRTEARVETDPGGNRQDQRVADDADQAVLDHRCNAPVLAAGGVVTVEQHVAPIGVHRPPHGVVVVLEVVVEVRDQLTGQSAVLIPGIQLLPLVEWRVQRDAALLSGVQRFGCAGRTGW